MFDFPRMLQMDCHFPDCRELASHWVLRHLPPDYLPNPDVRAYCDTHRSPDVQAAADATSAPVLRVEVIELGG